MNMIKTLLLTLSFSCLSCGSLNSTDEVSEKEKADAYLENKEYQKAVESYNIVISGDGDDYVSYRKLAAAYAGLAGFNLMDVVADSLGDIVEGSASGEDINEQLTELLKEALPNPPTQAQLDAFLSSVNTINTIPDTVDTGSSDYGTLEIQKVVIIAAYSIIFLNFFNDTAGNLDPSKLSNLSDAQADTLVGVLESLNDPIINSILTDVNSQSGSTTTEKVQNYINAQNL